MWSGTSHELHVFDWLLTATVFLSPNFFTEIDTLLPTLPAISCQNVTNKMSLSLPPERIRTNKQLLNLDIENTRFIFLQRKCREHTQNEIAISYTHSIKNSTG